VKSAQHYTNPEVSDTTNTKAFPQPVKKNKLKILNSCLIISNKCLHLHPLFMAYSEKQVQIIEAAEQLFASHGYGNTSVRQIADHAGVNLAMISYYFGSKEKLMHALVVLRTEHIRLTLENLLKDDSLTPLQKVNMMIGEYVERFAKRRAFYKIMVTEHMLDKNNDITKMLLEVKRKNAEALLQVIKEGQKKKAFRKNVDVVMLMNIMVGTVNHSLLNKEFYKEFHQLQKGIFKALLTYEA
jgi:AcrR family transcriptional regulator